MSELKLERHFKSSPETVFDFVTRTENLLAWWGPEGITLPKHQLDFTRLGPWMSVMKGSEGQTYKVSGDVLNIDPPHCVEFSWAWHDDETDERGHESRVQFLVTANDDGGTLFTLHHTELPSKEAADNHNEGWTSSFKKLEALDSNS